MNCNCIKEIEEKLKDKNLHLAGVAMVGPKFEWTCYIQTAWIDKNKAPKGNIKRPPYMFVSHCPFCGEPVEKK